MKTFLVVVFLVAIVLAAASAVLGYLTSAAGFMTLYYIAAVIALAALVVMCFGRAIYDLLKEDNRG
ncbi:MAG: hypothetical protein JWP32_2881 [Schumannella sp.]|nr:hypothetical protein [Schumannella sp.]